MDINKRKENITNICIGILVLIAYFFLTAFESVPLTLAGIDISQMSSFWKIVYMIAYEILLMLVIGLLLKNKIKKDYKDIKKNHKKYFSTCIKYWFISLGVMMFSNLIINSISSSGIAGNQETLDAIFKVSPIYMFFSAVLYAPFVEELTFRQGLRNIFKTDTIFILLSGLIFGSLHVLTSFETLTDLLYIIPYSAPGIAFAYMLTKYDNIFVSMGFHFMHNGILMAMQFMLLIFG